MRRYHIDRCAFAVRHNDGIKDIVLKLKAKCVEMINAFKKLPAGRKIVFLLSKLLQISGAVFAAKSGYDVVKEIKRVKATNDAIQDAWDEFNSLSGEDERPGLISFKTDMFLKSGVKLIGGLCMTLVGTVGQTLAVNR